MIKKLLLAAVVAISAFLLGGCSLTGLDAQGLILPPKANTNQQAIHSLLVKSEEAEIKFIYPKNGEFRSAVIMRDFTGDGTEDAIGFTAEPGGGVAMKFMVKENGEWSTLASVKNPATQVDRVCFGDLNGNGVESIIVGWGAPQSMTANIGVYSYANHGITETSLEHTYNELAVTDFNADGVKELFTATIFTETEEAEGTDKNAIARVFTFEENRPLLAYTCPLNDMVVKYSTISFMGIDPKTKGIVLDGVMADNSTITQLLYMGGDGKQLVSPLSEKILLREYNLFTRPASLSLASKDMNGDGIMEFPRVTLQPGYEAGSAPHSFCYYVDWVSLDTVLFEPTVVETLITNIPDNYSIVIPPAYRQNIGCFSTQERELTFRRIKLGSEGKIESSVPLFSIRVFTAEEWAKNHKDYSQLLKAQNGTIYGKRIFSEDGTGKNLLKSIKLILE